MKRHILSLAAFLVATLSLTTANGQSLALAVDQNPNFEVSRAKYMAMADSITAWHSTTPQETYRAIDYLEDKRIARAERQAFRRELRLERARNGGRWYLDNYYNDNYEYYRPNYPYRNRYNNGFYRRGPSYNRFYWNAIPSILTWGILCR